jgi:hypothetical protein
MDSEVVVMRIVYAYETPLAGELKDGKECTS